MREEVFDGEWSFEGNSFVFVGLVGLVESSQDVDHFGILEDAVRVLGSPCGREILVGWPHAAFPSEADELLRDIHGIRSFFTECSGEVEEDSVVVLRGEIADCAPEHVGFEGYCDLAELFVGQVAIKQVEEEWVCRAGVEGF